MKMYVNGVVLAGAGIGSMSFGMFSYSYVNPEKLRPLEGYYIGSPELEDIALKVPALLKYLALLYLCLGSLGVALMAPAVI